MSTFRHISHGTNVKLENMQAQAGKGKGKRQSSSDCSPIAVANQTDTIRNQNNISVLHYNIMAASRSTENILGEQGSIDDNFHQFAPKVKENIDSVVVPCSDQTTITSSSCSSTATTVKMSNKVYTVLLCNTQFSFSRLFYVTVAYLQERSWERNTDA